MSLSGKCAVVTGSTSGSASASPELARAGADVVLNSFSDAPRTTRSPSAGRRAQGRARLRARRHVQGGRLPRPGRPGARSAWAGSTCWSTTPASSTWRRSRSSRPRSGTGSWRSISAAFHTTARRAAGHEARARAGAASSTSPRRTASSPRRSRRPTSPPSTAWSASPRSIALETAETGITCNAICPGYVWTPLVEKQIDDQAKAHGIGREQVIRDVLLEPSPTSAFATVEELGALAVFLCGAGRRLDHRHRASGRRRLDRALKGRTAMDTDTTIADRLDEPGRRPRSRPSTWPCRAAAPTAPSPGASSTACSRTSASSSRASRATSAGAMNAVVLAYGLAEAAARRPRGARPGSGGGSADAAADRSAAAVDWLRLSRLAGNHALDYLAGLPACSTGDQPRVVALQLNPANYNPLRRRWTQSVDFDAARSRPAPAAVPVAATNVRTGKVTRLPRRRDHRRRRAGLGLPAVHVPGGGDRRRGLLGRRLHGQPGHLPADLPLRQPGHGHRPHQPARARGDAAHRHRDHEPDQRDHLQLLADARDARRSPSSPG